MQCRSHMCSASAPPAPSMPSTIRSARPISPRASASRPAQPRWPSTSRWSPNTPPSCRRSPTTCAAPRNPLLACRSHDHGRVAHHRGGPIPGDCDGADEPRPGPCCSRSLQRIPHARPVHRPTGGGDRRRSDRIRPRLLVDPPGRVRFVTCTNRTLNRLLLAFSGVLLRAGSSAARAEQAREQSLIGQSNFLGLYTSTFRVNGASILKVSVRARGGMAPRDVIDTVYQSVRGLDQILGAEIPVLLHIGHGFRTRRAGPTQLRRTLA